MASGFIDSSCGILDSVVYAEVKLTLKYTVSCVSPPSELKIEKGNKVRVKGIAYKEKVTAESIQNLTSSAAECKCSSGWEFKAAVPKQVDVIGLVTNIVSSKDAIQFDLETA